MNIKELHRLEVMGKLKSKHLLEGSELLGVSVRQVKRLCSKYRSSGVQELTSGHRGKQARERFMSSSACLSRDVRARHYIKLKT